jgi:hypothetical protein
VHLTGGGGGGGGVSTSNVLMLMLYWQGRRNDVWARGADFRGRALLNWYILRDICKTSGVELRLIMFSIYWMIGVCEGVLRQAIVLSLKLDDCLPLLVKGNGGGCSSCPPPPRAFFKDFPVGGIFGKGTFLWDNISEGDSNGWRPRVWPIYHAWKLGGEIWNLKRGNAIFCILRSKFALKFMLTMLVFEIKEGKKCTKSKKEY